MNERKNKLSKLAEEVLNLDRNTLLVNLRFMDMALSRLRYVESTEIRLSTDGAHMVYDPAYILQVFREEKEASVRDYLHVVFHCVYKHMFLHDMKQWDLWDLACDIAVEKTIHDLGLRSADAKRARQQEQVFNALNDALPVITADRIYLHYVKEGLSEEKTEEMRKLFYADNHILWYMDPQEKEQALGNGSDGNGDSGESSGDDDGDDDGDGDGGITEMSQSELEEDWQSIAEHMEMDLETFSKTKGNQAGSLMQNLREVNRETYNYEDFLRRFAVRGEVMKVDMDEFDYIFYTYGLQLYKNVPLVEPLEYKEVTRVKDFVIAIDTSGSTSGELVQRFIQKTYNILKSTESFFSRINLHIIQCDAKIQEDAKITSQEEFDAYLKTMQIRGLGGTDFRPVFRYVDTLIEQGEFENLKGMIYFTDGWGDFPEIPPAYDTAFVFIDDGENNYNVPSWAIKLILQMNELE